MGQNLQSLSDVLDTCMHGECTEFPGYSYTHVVARASAELSQL